jgi:hypothetical protein
MPTRVGDVLILCTTRSFTVYTVGRVSKDHQQGFYSAMDVKFLHTKATAKVEAKALVSAKGQIFFRDIDTGKWAKV